MFTGCQSMIDAKTHLNTPQVLCLVPGANSEILWNQIFISKIYHIGSDALEFFNILFLTSQKHPEQMRCMDLASSTGTYSKTENP